MKSCHALTVSESPRERRSPALQRAVGSRIVIPRTFLIKSNSNLIARWLLLASLNRGPIDKPSIPSRVPHRYWKQVAATGQRVGPVKDRSLLFFTDRSTGINRRYHLSSSLSRIRNLNRVRVFEIFQSISKIISPPKNKVSNKMKKIDRDDPRKRAIRAERKGESKSVGWKNMVLLEQRIFSVSKKLFFLSRRERCCLRAPTSRKILGIPFDGLIKFGTPVCTR